MSGGLLLFALAVFVLSGRETEPPASPPTKPPPLPPPPDPPEPPGGAAPGRAGSFRGRRVPGPVSGVVTGILGDKRAHGPHQGIDIRAPAGSEVRAWGPGIVARVVHGAQTDREAAQRAGLYIDVHGDEGNTHRFLHLGRALVQRGDRVARGQPLGTVEADHLHFEVRRGHGQYGPPLDPFI